MTAPTLHAFREIKQKFSDPKALEDLSLKSIEKVGRKGGTDELINYSVAQALNIEEHHIPAILLSPDVISALQKAREDLRHKKLIAYNSKELVWYLQKKSIGKDLTAKERAYFKARNFGPGWRRVPDKENVVQWLYESLTPLEFENLCISVLDQHCGVPIKITEKKPKSGADGGFDGIGEYEIDGQILPVALQVKKYAPHRQIGYDHCERFIGALVRRQWKHGFIITSGTFSLEAQRCIDDFSTQGILIELIDQSRLIDIMLLRNDLPHGFGVHMTSYGLVYINQMKLKKAAKKI